MFWRNLLSTSARTTVAAVAGSAATASGVDSDWYRRLDKPALQPPPAAFPIAWTLLYADIAVTSAAVLTELQQRARPELRAQRGAFLDLVTSLAAGDPRRREAHLRARSHTARPTPT